jgi:hypothetical protein
MRWVKYDESRIWWIRKGLLRLPAVALHLGPFDQDIPHDLPRLVINNLLKLSLDLFEGFPIKRLVLPRWGVRRRRLGLGNLTHSEANVLDSGFPQESVYFLEECGFEELKLLHPGWVGDVKEKNSVPNQMGLALQSDRLPHNFFPVKEDGVSLDRTVNLQAL